MHRHGRHERALRQQRAFGLRLNAAAANTRPEGARGRRQAPPAGRGRRLAAGPGTLLEAEVETSRRSQPSVPGFSMLGDRVPSPGDPRINLNNQSWAQPWCWRARPPRCAGSSKLADGWKFVAHAATQRLTSDDRIAFPFGCFDAEPGAGRYLLPDRYCPDGSFDLYDFRSDNERRTHQRARPDALRHAAHRHGRAMRCRDRRAAQPRDEQLRSARPSRSAAPATVDGSIRDLPANPAPTDENTNRANAPPKLSLRDAIAFDDRNTLWLGVALHRQSCSASFRTDPQDRRETDYQQSFTTPWSRPVTPSRRTNWLYASWGEGSSPPWRRTGTAIPTPARRWSR